MPRFPHRLADLPRTSAARCAAGCLSRSVKDEIAANLLDKLAVRRRPVARHRRLHRTVLPQLERALLAGHDVVLLGERGQGKTWLLRTIALLLDEWTPVIDGAELPEHPLAPITPAWKRRAAEAGDELLVRWVHRSERYAEKLATPETKVMVTWSVTSTR